MKITLTKRDIIWSYFAQIFQYGASFFIIPIVLRKLPSDELGVWYIFLAVYSFIALLDFGFQPTISRNITYIFSGAKKLLKEGIADKIPDENVDYLLLKTTIKICRKIYAIISLIAFVLLITVGTYYIYSLVSEKPNLNFILVSWLVFALSCIINFYYSYYNALLQGRGLIKEISKTIIFSKVFYILFSYLGLMAGWGLLAIASSNLLSNVINRVVANYYFYDKQLKSDLKIQDIYDNSSTLFKIIWHNSYKLGIVSLGGFLITRANIFICASYLTLQDVASYGLTQQFLNIINTLSLVYFNINIPKFNQYSLLKDKEALKQGFGFSLIIGFVLFFSGIIVLFLGGDALLQLIGSNTLFINKYYLLFYGIILFLEFNHSMSATLITTGNIIPFVKPSVISGIFILVFSFILIKFTSLGILSLLISQFVIQACYNNWKWPLVVVRNLNTSYPGLFFEAYKYIKAKIRLHGK